MTTPDDWNALVAAAQNAGGFAETLKLDRALTKQFGGHPPEGLATKPVRLAALGSSTLDHLLPGLRVGALRRGIWLAAYTPSYGQYMQEMLDPASALHAFKATATLFAFDALHLFGEEPDASALEAACNKLRQLWRQARKNFGGQVIQQTVLPTPPALVGHNEHRLPTSPRRLVSALNERLRTLADEEGVDLLALDDRILHDGIKAWHDPMLWHMAKQDITPAAAPAYGDMVARLLAAKQGRSYKCLVLDLDNTLWGGVIGDDGLEGIALGQGNARGEAYLALQRYARALARRGVILAVCSKNDEANALAAFDRHPQMILKRSDIACFVANWQDKPANLRAIAEQLNIGIDSLVFVDDNAYERNLVRRELPMVAVPELPEDPSLYVEAIAAGGYFEALSLTPEDFERTGQYQANSQREALKASATDMASYLKSLGMELHYQPFSRLDLGRVVQLINKTNQFNLTTRRYGEDEVLAVMNDPKSFTLQLRLTDQFGDNGIIALVIGTGSGDDMLIDTWLMSCRVLGRGVEEATLNLVAAAAQSLGARRLIGEYRPTSKNGMVQDHYPKLGFLPLQAGDANSTRWGLTLERFQPKDTFIAIKDDTHG